MTGPIGNALDTLPGITPIILGVTTIDTGTGQYDLIPSSLLTIITTNKYYYTL